MATTRGGLDPLLRDMARAARAKGVRVAGVVQVNTDPPGGARCDMDAIVLPDGPTIRISQSLGPEARGCRLDPNGLETAVSLTQTALDRGADLLIINKFGKQEVAGRGFRPLIAQALDQGTDVLIGVNPLNQTALCAFAGGLAQPLSAEPEAIKRWLFQDKGLG